MSLISVTASPADVVAGQAIAVTYEVAGDLDPRYTTIRAGLTCIGTYIDQRRSYDGEGHAHTTDVTHEVYPHDEEHDVALAPRSAQVTFTVPTDAPPTSTEMVNWIAWAGLVGPDNAVDPIERVEITVRAPDAPAGEQADVTDSGITLRGLPDHVRGGEPFSATVVVQVADDVKAGVRIHLTRRRTYVAEPVAGMTPGQLLLTAAGAAGQPFFTNLQLGLVAVDIAERQDFRAGTPTSIPFTITAPADAGPSTLYANGQVDWVVAAILDRRMHADVSVETGIVVT